MRMKLSLLGSLGVSALNNQKVRAPSSQLLSERSAQSLFLQKMNVRNNHRVDADAARVRHPRLVSLQAR